jgi:hypothetical protein
VTQILPLLVGSMMVFSSVPVAAQSGSYEHVRMLSDRNLNDIRGGFLLPNGMDIGLGITVDTRIDGGLALSTVLTVDDAAHLAIYSGGNGQGQTAATIFLVPGPHGPSFVRVTQGALPSPGTSGRQPIAATPNGAPVQIPWGAVQLAQSDTQSTVVLVGEGIELRHMIGAVTGALVANTGSGRVIETTVTIDLDIRHSAIPIGTMTLGLDTLLAGAAARGAY